MSTKHLTYLDSLRGLAAMTVIFSHYVQFFHMNNFIHTGKIAVCLFFILSGFVLSQRFLGTCGMKWAIIEAVIKRPFRLLGVVWCTVILGLLINVFVQGITPVQLGKSWMQFVIDFFVSPFATGEIYNSVLWTIHWELWGAMIVFGTVFVCGPCSKYLRLAIFSIVLIFTIRSYYGMLIVGMIVAELHKNFYWEALVKYRNLLSGIAFVAGIVICILYLAPDSDPAVTACISNGSRMIAACLIFIAVMLNTTVMRSALDGKAVSFLGNISYSLYAIHFLIMETIAETVDTMLNQFLQKEVAFYGTILITLPVIIFAAWIMDKYVDKPCIKLSGRTARNCIQYMHNGWLYAKAKFAASPIDSLDPDIETK